MNRRFPWGLLVLIAVWFILSIARLVDPLFLPSPISVVGDFVLFLKQGLLGHVGATLYRLGVGFALGIVIGLPIGLLMGYSARVYAALEAVVELFRSIPVIAIFPLFLILFGLGDAAKFAIAAWSTSFLVLINAMYGVRHGSVTRRLVARSLRATQRQIFWYVVLPDAMPNVIVGLRTAVSIGLIVVLTSEMFLGTHKGLGQAIYNAHIMYDIPRMYVAILVSGAIGYSLNLSLLFLERRLLHWRMGDG